MYPRLRVVRTLNDNSVFPEQNIRDAKAALDKYGITNPYMQAGIMATVGKETGFKPISEYSYRNTATDRISPPGLKQIFVTRLAGLTNSQIDALKVDNIAFFDTVYGGMLGNDQPGDGWKYRGRGYNGITGKGQYAKYGKILGVDLVSNPDLLNDPRIAAEALALYFLAQIKAGVANGYFKSKYGINDPNEITDTTTGTKAAVQMNAGWRTSFNNSVIQKGYKDALSTVDYFLGFANAPVSPLAPITNVMSKLNTNKLRRNLLIAGGLAVLAGGTYYLYQRNYAKVA
jgi:predicted chitinase